LAPGGILNLLFIALRTSKDPVGVGMAKALLGQRAFRGDLLVIEAARLRSRVRDLETLIEDLQHDNDRLRADLPAKIGAVPEPVH
jgi:hypothetical protein